MAWAVLGASRAQFLPCLPTENLRFELENDTGEAIGIGIQPPFPGAWNWLGFGAVTSLFQEKLWEFARIGGYEGSKLLFVRVKVEIAGLGFCVALQDATGSSPWVLPHWFETQTMDQSPRRWDNDPRGDSPMLSPLSLGHIPWVGLLTGGTTTPQVTHLCCPCWVWGTNHGSIPP